MAILISWNAQIASKIIKICLPQNHTSEKVNKQHVSWRVFEPFIQQLNSDFYCNNPTVESMNTMKRFQSAMKKILLFREIEKDITSNANRKKILYDLMIVYCLILSHWHDTQKKREKESFDNFEARRFFGYVCASNDMFAILLICVTDKLCFQKK